MRRRTPARRPGMLCMLAIAATLLAWSALTLAARSDWPESWRGRLDPSSETLLDQAYAKLMADSFDADLFQRAASTLATALAALPPTTDAQELRRRGQAWLFVAELQRQQGSTAAWEAAEAAALNLLEVSLPADSPELAEPLASHANSLVLLNRPEAALELADRAAAIATKRCGTDDTECGRLSFDIGVVFMALKHYEAGIPWLQKALSVSEATLGANNAETLKLMRDLAFAYYGAMRYPEAVALFERRLSITETLEKPPGEEVAGQLDLLVQLHDGMGDSAGALALAERRLEIVERIDGPDSPETASALRMIGNERMRLDHYLAAEPPLLRALAIQERRFGDANIDTARTLTVLGTLYVNMGRYAQAEPLLKRSLAAYEKVAEPENPEIAAAIANLAALYQGMGRWNEARPLYEREVALLEKLAGPNHPLTAMALRGLAALYRAELDYDRALPLLQRALSIVEAANGPDHPYTVGVLQDLGGLYVDMFRFADAAPLLRRAVEASERTTGPTSVQTALSLGGLAHLYWTMGMFHDALPLAQRVLEISLSTYGEQHLNTATALDSLGTGQQMMGELVAALASFQRAREIRERALGPENATLVISWMNLAGTYEELGQYAEALPLLEHSVATLGREAGPDSPKVAEALNNLALLRVLMGQPALALPLAQRSLDISEKAFGPNSVGTAAALGTLAIVKAKLGDNEAALALTRRAREIGESVVGPDHPSTVALVAEEASLYVNEGAADRALPLYEKYLATAEKTIGPDSPAAARGMVGVGRALLLSGRASEATPRLLRADGIGVARRAPDICWSAEAALSHAYRVLHQPLLAVFWAKQAVNTVQGVRAGLAGLDKDTRHSFLDADRRGFYTYLADLLVAQGRIPEAQAVMRMLKDDEYFEFLQRDATTAKEVVELPLTGVEQAANERFYAVRQRLADLGQEQKTLLDKQQLGTATPADLQRLAAINGDLKSATKAFDDFVAGLEQSLAGTAATAATAREVANQLRTTQSLMVRLERLGQHVAALQYVISDERLHVIVTTGSIQLAHDVQITPAELNARILAFRQAVQDPAVDPRPLGRELYAALIAPALPDLEAQHVDTLMLVLDDALRYVPFAALTSGDHYLIEQYDLALFTAGSEWALALKDDAPWRVAAMGMTRAVPELGLPPLDAVTDELQGIVRPDVLPGTIRFDADFNRAALEASLRTPVIHIASHFSFVPGSDESFLLLGDGSRLTLADVRVDKTMRFDDVELLTLSACNTATGGGRRANGAEVEGLGRLAQDKGAKSVMATLWPVADRSTGLLMQEFYRDHQQRHLDKAAALRAAQLALLHGTVTADPGAVARGAQRTGTVTPNMPRYAVDPKAPFAHPYFWAPFILMGNWL